VRGGLDPPRHLVSQELVPQDTTASAQALPKSSHTTLHGPLPQSTCAALHASSLPHATSHAAAPVQVMVALLQLALPRQRTRQAIPSGHSRMESLHWSLPSQVMMQTPASQLVHSGGQIVRAGSSATPQPSPVPPSPPLPAVEPPLPPEEPPAPAEEPSAPAEEPPSPGSKVNSSLTRAGHPDAESPPATASRESTRRVTTPPRGVRRSAWGRARAASSDRARS
jgi:hypothetical protein